MRMPERAGHFCNLRRFMRRFGAKPVVDRQHKEFYAARRGPVMGEMQEREGITAAGDGKTDRAFKQGRRQRFERRCKTFFWRQLSHPDRVRSTAARSRTTFVAFG